jgi:3-oxoacyl-[acyl-carrier protein] reductase
MINQTLEKFGQIDVCINNSGITKDGLLLRMKEEDFDAVIDINLKGAFNVTQAVLKPMMKARFGRIINMSSVIGQIGNMGQANYAASKGGLISFTKSVARELASRNITCNAIAPGFIQTKMTDVLSEDVKNGILKQIPLNRFGSVEDIAHAALFLASDNASYITGQVINVDGGMVM